MQVNRPKRITPATLSEAGCAGSNPAGGTLDNASDIRDAALSADGRIAVTGESERVTVWTLADPAHPVKKAEPVLPENFAEATAMSADGRTIVVANAGRADVWRLDDRARPVHTAALDVPPIDMYDVAVTPDGKTALMAGAGGTGFLWDLSDPHRPVQSARLRGYSQDVGSVALNADGRIALMASPDRGLSLWDLHDLAAIAADPAGFVCSTSQWQLSRADWLRYAGGADLPDSGGDQDSVQLCAIH
ncbi:WD40 repeat domain-containing protein [Nonomuraea dietziae]|uniref:WD40 repeat domain-containing protein n=1 Tax=Nonomuraea dietziae TaxID=65515 RepID=UPI00340E23F7